MHTTILLDTDSYKGSHWLQVPSDCTAMGAYLESRGGEVNETLFFGLQMILQTSLERPISQAELEEAAEIWALHGLPFNRQGWQRVVQVHGGRLPLRIRAVPEGLRVPTGQVLMTVESTDPELAWLVTWVETVLLRVWYPTTVATRSWQLRRLLEAALERSADDPAAALPFRLHDFGSRGVSSAESAAIGGLAHLIAFRGTDTTAALVAGRRYYDCPMAGFSIPAAEHSTILAWGQEQEVEAYRTILECFARPGAVLAVVSDSYDLWHAVDHLWGEQLRPQVIASGATVVIRPDSGEPQRIVPELLHRLEARFGSTVNGKGYRVLEHVRVIQGDGITVHPRTWPTAWAAACCSSSIATRSSSPTKCRGWNAAAASCRCTKPPAPTPAKPARRACSTWCTATATSAPWCDRQRAPTPTPACRRCGRTAHGGGARTTGLIQPASGGRRGR